MKKLLYISNVYWEWIYQRPQIIADGLSDEFEVTYVYQKWPFMKLELTRDTARMKYRRFSYIPFVEVSKIARKFYVWYNLKNTFYDLDMFDYVYICYPSYKMLLENYKGKIIYDCIDNHAAMTYGKILRNFLEASEIDLINRSSKIFATAKLLQDKIYENTGKKAALVRNGYIKGKEYPIKKACVKDKYTVGYFGTIASWFDYKSLAFAHDKVKNVSYRIIGPGKNRVNEDYISYRDSVEHGLLYENVKDCDCLILPFVLNEITLSVDPVKLYEYIDFGKCIISVYYPEIERFGDFVYFYKDEAEYAKVLSQLVKEGFPPKYNDKQREEFLQQNTWECRIKQIIREITDIDG